MSKTVDKLRAKLLPLGVTIEDTDYSLHFDAPSGYIWCANGLPSYHVHYATNSESWLRQALQSEMEALRMGLEKVTDPGELERARWDLDDDAWGAPADAPATIEWPS